MKLCPQCDFIYEDEQGFCDMDGKELVFSLAPAENQANIADALTPSPALPTAPPQRGLAAAIVVVVVLATLVIALYLLRKYQIRSGAATETSTQLPDRSARESAAQSNSETTNAQPSTTQTTGSPEVSAESSPAEGDDASPTESETSKTALAHTRLAAGSVSAGASSPNSRTSVIVRLNNGAVIKADEAWEKREGVWYRQAGMVTFVKRSQVKSIERLAAAAPSQSVARTAADKSTKTATTQNQLRLARLEPVEPKKPSRFTSFWKKTGRVLKKPFKL